MIKSLLDDEYFRVEYAPDMDVYRVARKARPFPADTLLVDGPRAVATALGSVPPGAKVLLDLRDDPMFEHVINFTRKPFAKDTLTRFAKVAVLVNKPAQVQRIASSDAIRGFDNEDKAFDHLLG